MTNHNETNEFAQSSKIEVRNSPLHGKGIFARDFIKAGEFLIEYEGRRITSDEADDIVSEDDSDPYHTFNFSLDNGMIIDPRFDGNDARWMNHSCDPNVEARQDDNRVFLYALKDIEPGQELFFDYSLEADEDYTEEFKARYACRCGAANCRGTMLNLNYDPEANRERRFKEDTEAALIDLQESSEEIRQQVVYAQAMQKATVSLLLDILIPPDHRAALSSRLDALADNLFDQNEQARTERLDMEAAEADDGEDDGEGDTDDPVDYAALINKHQITVVWSIDAEENAICSCFPSSTVLKDSLRSGYFSTMEEAVEDMLARNNLEGRSSPPSSDDDDKF